MNRMNRSFLNQSLCPKPIIHLQRPRTIVPVHTMQMQTLVI